MRKEFICVLLSLILAFSILNPLETAHALISPTIRVRISTAAASQLGLTVNGDYSLDGVPISRGEYAAVTDGVNVTLFFGGAAIKVVPVSQSIRLVHVADNSPGDNFIWINNSAHGGNFRYPGDLEIRANGGSIEFISHIHIEHYLCGVVPHEMSNSWPIEALKAQAIVARTYARNMIAKAGASATFDVIDTSNNQVYKGYNAAHNFAIQAVNETAGQVLKLQDGSAYVDTYYAASNGGWTDIPQHRWTVTNPVMPYHIIQPDPFDIANTWSIQEMIEFPKTVDGSNPIRYWDWSSGTMVTGNAAKDDTASRFLRASALEAFRNQGYIANVTEDLEIVGFSGFTAHTHVGNHGARNDFTNTNPCPCFRLADVTMTALAWRYAPNSGGGVALGDVNADGAINISDYTLVRLHILGLKLIPDNLKAAADVNRDAQINISDYTLIRLHILGLKPIEGTTSDGLVREPATVTFTIDMTQLEPSGSYPVFYRSLRLMTVEDTGGTFRLWRRRFGYTTGLSQRGAQQRAKPVIEGGGGQLVAEILAFYYPNTSIVKEY